MSGMKKNYQSTFFISTGRCATQWFADKIGTYYDDLAEVTHEPLITEYAPRVYFSAYNQGKFPELSKEVKSHIEHIKETLKTKHYIETGWTVYGVLPFVVDQLKGRVNIVHLYRHPANVAASLTTHKVYGRGEWSDIMALTPSEKGVVQGYLGGGKWKTMSEFEKCLFWWTEINAWAFKLKDTYKQIPWLSVKYEDVFYGQGQKEMEKILNFLSLPKRKKVLSALGDKTDKYSHKTELSIDIDSIREYPVSIKIMKELGYGMEEVNDHSLRKRYAKKFYKKILSFLKDFSVSFRFFSGKKSMGSSKVKRG